MAEEKEAEQAPEIRRLAEEDVHYNVLGIKLSELLDRGLVSRVKELSPGVEIKGIALGGGRRDTWVFATETKPVKGRPSFHLHSFKAKDTKLTKLMIKAIEEVSK